MRNIVVYKCEHCDIDPNVPYTMIELESMGYEIFEDTKENQVHKRFFDDFAMPVTVLRPAYDTQQIMSNYLLHFPPELSAWNDDFVEYKSGTTTIRMSHSEHKHYLVDMPHSCWIVKTDVMCDSGRNHKIFTDFNQYYHREYGIHPPCNMCLALSVADINFLKSCGFNKIEDYQNDGSSELYIMIL